MPHFTDLPSEVLALIGDLIDTVATRKTLVLVSRFGHQHFAHLLWRHLRITRLSTLRFVKIVATHAHLVRTLKFKYSICKGFYQIDFPGLVAFQHNYPEKDRKNKSSASALSEFISRHRTI